MWAATAWDDSGWGDNVARGWTVMGRLRERQRALQSEIAVESRRTARDSETLKMMTAASRDADYKAALRSVSQPGPTVLAFLFAQPNSEAIANLDSNGSYFDQRSGDMWDLFFPGYYRSDDCDLENRVGAKPVGSDFARGWFFNPNDFNNLRHHVQDASNERWKYSGLTDLVLVCAWLEKDAEPSIDWASTLSGSVTGTPKPGSLTLNEVIERISDDLESGAEDSNFGVREITETGSLRSDYGIGRDLMVNIFADIATALGKKALGI